MEEKKVSEVIRKELHTVLLAFYDEALGSCELIKKAVRELGKEATGAEIALYLIDTFGEALKRESKAYAMQVVNGAGEKSPMEEVVRLLFNNTEEEKRII